MYLRLKKKKKFFWCCYKFPEWVSKKCVYNATTVTESVTNQLVKKIFTATGEANKICLEWVIQQTVILLQLQ